MIQMKLLDFLREEEDIVMKKALRKIREYILWILPDNVLFYLENHLKNPDLRGYVQQIRLDRFIEKTDFK